MNLATEETFEIEQRITEPALTEHPETGDPVKRLIQPVGIAFKGSGFYVNDSRKAPAASKPVASNGKSSETSSSDKGSSDKGGSDKGGNSEKSAKADVSASSAGTGSNSSAS